MKGKEVGVSFDPMEKVIGNQRKTGHGRRGEKDEGLREEERERRRTKTRRTGRLETR